MEIKGIKYVAPVFNVSGYAEAARNYILALHKLGIPITIEPVSFEHGEPDLGSDGEILKSLVDRDIDYNIVIIQLTVEHYEKFYEPGKFMIGYSIWETDRIHEDWVKWINNVMDVIFTASDWGVDVYKKSGVVKPIFKVPHCIDVTKYRDINLYKVNGVNDSAYKFYAMFQFLERKNPLALIKAYWYAFQENEDVALILKTYRRDFSAKEREAIRKTLRKLKEITPMKKYPPVYLVLDKLSNDEILGLHAYGDCLVHLDRGEGWGLVPFTAGIFGNPIVVTGWGGVTEYAKPDNSYLVDYILEPVFGMTISPYYNGNQLWAYPDIYGASKILRHIYNNRNEAKIKGEMLQNYINNNFSHEIIGKLICDIINNL